ncbi:hypothetical protein J2Z30_009789 [Streptomyces iranensis]|uniref:Transposase n=1 Tax=Streptomyces iranensis TaxID=576784 RepID=A0ABS4N9M2_9ACTN|nr:hypothetical protein [Streptomyces iranensis]
MSHRNARLTVHGRRLLVERVRADRAYASRANRACLRRRGIRCTTPDKADRRAAARSGALAVAGRPSSTLLTTARGMRSSAASIAP